MLLLIGRHKFSDRKMYWETTHDTFVYARPDSMPRNMFERILRNVHLCDNEQLDKLDILSKLCSVILTFYAKSSILDVWQDSEFASESGNNLRNKLHLRCLKEF